LNINVLFQEILTTATTITIVVLDVDHRNSTMVVQT